MKARYNGPMIVISRSKRGPYVLAEMDGLVFQQKIGAFRVIPYFAMQNLKIPEGVLSITDVSKAGLEKIQAAEKEAEGPDKDFGFESVNLRAEGVDFSDDDLE